MTTINAPETVPTDIQNEMKEIFGLVPSFARVLTPDQTRQWWTAVRDFQLSDQTALSPKVKELIGLGVSAQIPCHYCVEFHTEAARLNGATEAEIQEAVFMASLTRMGSTILNGTALDQATFDKELHQIVEHIKTTSAPTATV